MSRRLLPLAAVVAALTLPAGPALAAHAVHPRAGAYKGRTSQQGPLTITVAKGGRKATSIRVGFVAGCLLSGGSHQYLHTFRGRFPIRHGVLQAHRSYASDWAIDLTAHFKRGGKAGGKVDAATPDTCLGSGITFHVKRR